uniref:Uncharacterized protein n=1 Tax=Cacopsylla melanoneura TaxID=428564 RepID=A0A8D8XXL7_9HEMI
MVVVYIIRVRDPGVATDCHVCSNKEFADDFFLGPRPAGVGGSAECAANPGGAHPVDARSDAASVSTARHPGVQINTRGPGGAPVRTESAVRAQSDWHSTATE